MQSIQFATCGFDLAPMCWIWWRQ
uniref:Uncharacterized protein n=1 Tax=Arundo donax TaxID=35708 RepID=A0A0A9APU4_ARUDO